MGFATDAIHAGQKPDMATGAVMTPIYMTSTYHQEEIGVHKGYEYGRTENLTREALQDNIAALEQGKYGLAFASGLAAIQALMGLVKQGDHVVVSNNVYGGTYRLFEMFIKDYGIDFSWVDASDLNNIKAAVKDNTKIVYIETPTNPMLNLTDIEGVANFCKENGYISIVDNTFMSPFFQKPLLLGADIVVHSSTKYLNGHSDVIGGIIVTSNEQAYEKLRFIQRSAGAVPSPFDCWLTLRATKTLHLRMERHNQNAIKIANYLQDSPFAEKVIYPGLENHPQHELAKKQMTGFGGMVSVDFGSVDKAYSFAKKIKVFTLAESLGGVESLVCHPASMTHASVPEEDRLAMGLTNSLIRLSVGVEDAEDLIQDIEHSIK